MKKTFTLVILSSFSWLMLTSSFENSAGKAGYTGSPGETTCSTSGCHSTFAPNTQGGSITISAPGMTNWQYVPGETYTISVTVAETGRSLFGLGFEALTSGNDNAGNLIPGAGTQILTRFVQGVSRRNITHQDNAGLSPNSHTFTFTWEAPTENIGNVTFYTAGNAANNNNTASGDHIYSTSQVITPATSVGINEIGNTIDLVMFPNPVVNTLNMNYSVRKSGRAEAVIYDTMGKKVLNVFARDVQPGSYSEIIDVSVLSKGQYILHFAVDGEILKTEVFMK